MQHHLKRLVHIVDDDATVRAAMGFLLGQLGIAHAAYASGQEFLDTADLGRGAVLLDLKMEDMDGLQVLQNLRDRGASLPVILVSGYPDLGSVVGAMKLGAVDVLQKPCATDELVSALDRSFAISADHSAQSATQVMAAKKLQALSPRQRQILQGMVAGMANKTIARHFDLSPRTVEMHRATVFNRLGVANIAEAVRIAIDADLPLLPRDASGDEQ